MNSVQTGRRVRLRLRQQVEWGRLGMLAMVAVTLVNQLLLALGVDYHFLFSAALPYYLNWSLKELGIRGAASVFAGLLTVAVYVAYLACWLLSGRRREWLAAALGLYAVDTLLLIIFAFTMLESAAACVLEILTHGVLIAVLFVALQAAQRLSRMPRIRRLPNSA